MSTAIRSAPDAVQLHLLNANKRILGAIKLLLETKHLYQAVDVDLDSSMKDIQTRLPSHLAHALIPVSDIGNWPWIVPEPTSIHALSGALASTSNKPTISLKPPDVKLFCQMCSRLEPFNYVEGSNTLGRTDFASGGVKLNGKLHQVYCMTYLCQSCKSVPEVFLIRRVATKLALCGRAPMEQVQTPKAIPKQVARYYSGAVVAYQSGQTLAALFMLRTLCEQWARFNTQSDDKTDDVMKQYMGKLPDDFKARFPSLPTIYSQISAALHKADASDSLFETTLLDIEKHFSARDIFGLTI